MQFEGVSALRAEAPAGDGRIGIALNINQLAVLVINELAAPNSAIWADGFCYFSPYMAGLHCACLVAVGDFPRCSQIASSKLFYDWPALEKVL